MSALVAGRAAALPSVRKGASVRCSSYISRVPVSHSRPRPFSGVAKATAGKVPDFFEIMEAEAEDEEVDSLEEAEADPETVLDFDENEYDDSDESLLRLQAEIEELEAEEEALAELLNSEAAELNRIGDDAEVDGDVEGDQRVRDWDGEELSLEDLGLSDSAQKSGEIDSDILAAMAVAAQVVRDGDVEAVLEADLESSKAVYAFERLLDEDGASAPLVKAVAGDDVAEVELVEDVQGPGGVRKYDEEEEASMSVEEAAQVDTYKLSRKELSNLVPKDWDTLNLDWDDNNSVGDKIPLPEYRLVFIWQEKNLAVAVDQVFSKGQTSPLTEYFFWPRKDAWDDLRAALEARPFISTGDRSLLLNRLTEVINVWQDEALRRSISEARAAFPDCAFI